MKKTLLALICLSTGSILFAQEKSENSFTAKWDKGYHLTSADGQFKLRFGGRIHYDNAFLFEDDTLLAIARRLDARAAKINNGTQFRRVRFYNEGQLYHNVRFRLQLDFAGGRVLFRDVFMELSKLPVVGNLTVGQFKEPFRLEVLTSSNYITFIERAFPVDYTPERNTGIMLHNDVLNKRLSWQAAIFRNADDSGNDRVANDGYNLTTRLTGLPYVSEDKSKLLHLGLSGRYHKPRTAGKGTYRISSRPETHIAHPYIFTDTIGAVDAVSFLGSELALVLGTFSVQSEWVQAAVQTKQDNYSFASFYVQLSYFLTGENRTYSSSYSGFGRISPKKNFGKDGGLGAWEIALRYSDNNLNSGSIRGGQLSNITAGLNWYLNPVTRIMFNYTLAQLKDTGNASIVQMRWQVDF